MGKYVFGIDLGTTYSCIAYVDETGRATVINNSEGSNTTPSVVNFSDDNEVVVGEVAKQNAVIEPDTTSILVKTLIGKTDFAINYNGEDKSPEEVSAYILKKLAQDASKNIDEEVKDVVITCPAYFGTAERLATKNAGVIAGLNVLEIISEPTAAALYYGCTKEQQEKTILVYDLGGGTFDVTIMRISSEKIEVVCSDGDHELGGKDWDESVMRYLVDEFRTEKNYEGDIDEYSQQDLRLKAENAKQQLSSKSDVKVIVDISGLKERITLSRDVFDDITENLLNETIKKTDDAIKLAADKGYEIDEILLVGGSTRMPQVEKILIEKYKKKPKVLEPDEAVAKGAAIHAVNVYMENKQKVDNDNSSDEEIRLSGMKKEDYSEDLTVETDNISIAGTSREIIVATTKSFAVEVMKNDQPKCCNMIIKNEKMMDGEISITKAFGTYEANMDSVSIKVFESDFMEPFYEVDEDYILGTADLKLPGNLPANAPIEISFTLNKEGILKVRGRDLTSNKEINATMQARGIMAQEVVEELAEKSKRMIVI